MEHLEQDRSYDSQGVDGTTRRPSMGDDFMRGLADNDWSKMMQEELDEQEEMDERNTTNRQAQSKT